MAIQDHRARDIRQQHGNQRIRVPRRELIGRSHEPLDDHGHLGADAHGVQNQESRVTQPVQKVRDEVELLEREIGVADDLGGGPRGKHGAVPGRGVELRERVGNAPDEHKAGGDLHEGGEEGGGDDAFCKQTN